MIVLDTIISIYGKYCVHIFHNFTLILHTHTIQSYNWHTSNTRVFCYNQLIVWTVASNSYTFSKKRRWSRRRYILRLLANGFIYTSLYVYYVFMVKLHLIISKLILNKNCNFPSDQWSLKVTAVNLTCLCKLSFCMVIFI